MNRHSAKKRPKTAAKGAGRKVSPALKAPLIPVQMSAELPAQLAYKRTSLRAHKYQVGQTVFYTSSPISRPGASGAYKVVRLLPSDGEDYQYRIKNSGEAFERVAKESQLERSQ
jgi:hypothetical protein